MGNSVQPLLTISFFGPWVPQPGSKERIRHHYMSLAHWYECAKFMPAHPELRDAVGFCPTVKEARKFSKSRQKEWRSDWNLIRHRVLIAGLGFLALDRPDLEMAQWPKAEFSAQLAGMKLPERFLDACLDEFLVWASGPRIATFGAEKAPEPVVGRKMSKVVQNKPSWTLTTLCNGKASWRLHDWALSMYIPVSYIGTPNSRTTTGLVDELLDRCDQLVVFEVKGGRGSDSVIQRARARKIPLSLELFQSDDQGNRTIV